MAEISGFVIAFGLAFAGAGEPDIQQQDRYMSAAGKALTCGYIQSGMKRTVDKGLKDFERRYIPKPVAKYGSMTVIVIKTIQQGQLTLVWSF